MNGDAIIITLREGVNGALHVTTKFDPPVEDPNVLAPLVEAAQVAVGAISNYCAGLPYDDEEKN